MALAQLKSVEYIICEASDSPDMTKTNKLYNAIWRMTDPAAAKPEPCWRWIRLQYKRGWNNYIYPADRGFWIFDMAKNGTSPGYKNARISQFAHNQRLCRLGGQ